jgi:hypothetical protein
MSTISYRIVAQSRENYLSTAALTSSNIGIAVNLGYSAFRGSNLKRLIQITPNGNYTLPKFSVIGSYNSDYDILTLDDEELVEGVTKNIRTVVGNVREDSIITGTSDIKIFSLFTGGISDDFILFKDNDEVPTTDIIKDMIYDKYLVRTNPYGSVDIAYLNTFTTAKYKYGTGTEITIRYVELADVPVIPYDTSMFTYGELGDVTTISSYIPFETAESLKVTAPLDHETQNLIRSKADYANRLQEIIPSVIQTNWIALTPTFTVMTYLEDTGTLLTGTRVYPGTAAETKERLSNTEIEKVRNILKDENFFGTPLPDILPPRREVADIKIQLALTDKYRNISDINLDIDNILKNYYNRELSAHFNVYDLERLIENLEYVKYARVFFKVDEREPNKTYQLGQIVSVKNKKGEINNYKASKILGVTGITEPENGWGVPINPPTEIDTDIIIQDGSIYWKCFKKLPDMPKLSISLRKPTARYGIGDYMELSQYPDYMFKCVDIVRVSGTTEPDTTGHLLGDFIVDGNIVWVVKDYINDDNTGTWSSMTRYQLGQTVNAKGEYSLECVSYRGVTSTNENDKMSFEQSEYAIDYFDNYYQDYIVPGDDDSDSDADTDTDTNETEREYKYGRFYVEGDVTYYFDSGEPVEAITDLGVETTFAISGVVYPSVDKNGKVCTEVRVRRYQDGAASEPIIDMSKNYKTLRVAKRGTEDGDIEWTLVDNVDDMTYGWNSYVTFSHEVEILND